VVTPSLLVHLGAWSQVLPVAALAVRRPWPVAHRWVAGACLLSVVSDIAALTLSSQGINNHWLGYVSMPLMTSGFLIGLAQWQLGVVEKLTFRLAVPGFLIAWVVLVLVSEDVHGFSRYAGPLAALLTLAAGLYTLLRRGFERENPHLLRADWFWVAGGLALYGAAGATFPPVASALVAERVDLLVAAINVRATLYIVAFTAIAWGMICPLPVTHSGPSSSRRRSG